MNPKSILGRYLIKQIIVNFITVLMMVLGVVLLFEVVELLRRTSGRDDVDFAFVMEMAVTKLPKTVEMVFPFVVMIAAMVTFWKLSKSNEFVMCAQRGFPFGDFWRRCCLQLLPSGSLMLPLSIPYPPICMIFTRRWNTG